MAREEQNFEPRQLRRSTRGEKKEESRTPGTNSNCAELVVISDDEESPPDGESYPLNPDPEAPPIGDVPGPSENVASTSSIKPRTPSRIKTSADTLLIYPPPPMKSGITISKTDYETLGKERFLNDVIIDFYLSWLRECKWSAEDKERSHIVSSFFLKRINLEKNLPPEERYQKVKSWTKKVDIFEKDFIFIPICEDSHWTLCIICFCGLLGPYNMSDNTPYISPALRRENNKKKEKEEKIIPNLRKSVENWSLRLSPLKNNIDDDDKDDSEDITQIPKLDHHKVGPPLKRQKGHQGSIKQPCILIFDSLGISKHTHVVKIIREYLEFEFEVKYGSKRDFSKLAAVSLKLPLQSNGHDCGVFVLQYAESFMTDPIEDYSFPLPNLKKWFNASEVPNKRREIKELIHSLMAEQNIDLNKIEFPDLNISEAG